MHGQQTSKSCKTLSWRYRVLIFPSVQDILIYLSLLPVNKCPDSVLFSKLQAFSSLFIFHSYNNRRYLIPTTQNVVKLGKNYSGINWAGRRKKSCTSHLCVMCRLSQTWWIKEETQPTRHVSGMISERIVWIGRNNSSGLNKRTCRIHKRWTLMLLREQSVNVVTGEKEIHEEWFLVVCGVSYFAGSVPTFYMKLPLS